MKETGIIMSGDHPKLILDGRKTMTRRTYGLKKINEHPDLWKATPTMNTSMWAFYQGPAEKPTELIRVKCPYGGVGDRLWVRATWSKNFNGQMLFKYQYEKLTAMFDSGDRPDWLPASPPWPKLKWKPSIHLLKEDAEIWLEITEVRVERVQEITEEDAKAEGCPQLFLTGKDGKPFDTVMPTFWFEELWNSLNAKRGYGWDFNPWCWCISFKVV